MFICAFLAVQACASARWECMGTSVTTAGQVSRTSAAQGANLANAIIIAATATHSQVSHPHAYNIIGKRKQHNLPFVLRDLSLDGS